MNIQDYNSLKRKLYENDRQNSFEWDMYCNRTIEEEQANEVLKRMKEKEIENFRENLTKIPISSLHFSQIKNFIDKNGYRVFSLLNDLPKGILHHCHVDALIDAKWLIEQVNSSDTLYIELDENPNSGSSDLVMADFQYFVHGPPPSENKWIKVSDFRRNYKQGEAAFDQWLYECFTIVPTKEEDIVYTENEIWNRFNRTFKTIRGIFSYVPFTKLYLTEILKRYSRKDFQQLELRMPYYVPYDDNGIVEYGAMIDELMATFNEYKTANNLTGDDFFDLKFIISPTRNSSDDTLKEAMAVTFELAKKYPDQVVGFDMVGHEKTSTIANHLEILQDFQTQLNEMKNGTCHLRFYFHAGETTDSGSDTDNNLFDAVLMNTKRIGHAYSLSRHLLTLASEITKRNICLEICPISNQYLGLVKDMANHPIIIYMKYNLPVSVSSDDPALFGYEGATYDFYSLFMSFDSYSIWTLKKLCLNSIEYGTFTDPFKKVQVRKVWESKWKAWLSKINMDSESVLTN